ncbi:MULTISPECIES: OmpW family outer membrane protein [unclassified Iodidimonas]|jgi:outer membrane protein|uniref:OmpW/AlkL family protein n=1 Tax=unclassified Iodidimonas TaxID=2626145 RepID=UPI002482415D|nr:MULTISPECIES: OmpW family outer membrane protein [unclassified Iodidimonas]
MKLNMWAMAAMVPVLICAPDASAQDMVKAGDFLLRGRAILVAPDESATISAIGGDVGIDNAVMPELDLTYFITDHLAVELIAAVSPHDARAKGTALGDLELGELLLLPPTLTVQYHQQFGDYFKPYIGAGVNYTMFIKDKAEGGVVTQLKARDSFGIALQAGADFAVKGPWMINIDMKKLFLDTRVTLNDGAIEANVDIDPWIFGIGVGYKF